MEVMFSIMNESSISNWIEQSSFVHTMEPQLSLVQRNAILPVPMYVNVEFSSFYSSQTHSEGNREIMHCVHFACCVQITRITYVRNGC